MKKRVTGRTARLFFTSLVSASLILWTMPSTVRADGGELDPAFGSGGKVVTNISRSELGTAIAIQPDGCVVVAVSYGGGEGHGGDVGVARYLPTGERDMQFGFAGFNGLDFFGGDDIAHAVAIQADGKIVGGGEVYNPTTNSVDFGLCRFNPNGGRDSSFGNGEPVATDFFGLADRALGVAIQADGKIVVVGLANNVAERRYTDFALARYNADGSLDSSFGSGGRVVNDIFGTPEAAYAVKLQPGGKILAAGFAQGFFNGFALVRFNADGSPDTSFGYKGAATGIGMIFGCAYALDLQPDGKIILAGFASMPIKEAEFALVRVDADGDLDETFGSQGLVQTDFLGGSDVAFGVAVQPDGMILAAGYAEQPDGGRTSDFALARYDVNGSLDVSFGSGGKVTTDFFGDEDRAYSMALTAGGGIVLAGYANGAAGEDLALACYSMGVPSSPDFTLGFNQLVVNASRGRKVTITVDITRTGGFTGSVKVIPPDLSAEGIITKSPDPIKTKGASATWVIKVKAWATTGPHQITFVGRDTTGREHAATVILFVE